MSTKSLLKRACETVEDLTKENERLQDTIITLIKDKEILIHDNVELKKIIEKYKTIIRNGD
jgi:hypothetical protein